MNDKSMGTQLPSRWLPRRPEGIIFSQQAPCNLVAAIILRINQSHGGSRHALTPAS